MIQHNITPQPKRQNKDTKKRSQVETIFHYLQKHVSTAAMVADATGVPQKNICRYKRDLEKAGNLKEVKRGYCKATKHKAWYLTTDKAKFPTCSPQLNLF